MKNRIRRFLIILLYSSLVFNLNASGKGSSGSGSSSGGGSGGGSSGPVNTFEGVEFDGSFNEMLSSGDYKINEMYSLSEDIEIAKLSLNVDQGHYYKFSYNGGSYDVYFGGEKIDYTITKNKKVSIAIKNANGAGEVNEEKKEGSFVGGENVYFTVSDATYTITFHKIPAPEIKFDGEKVIKNGTTIKFNATSSELAIINKDSWTVDEGPNFSFTNISRNINSVSATLNSDTDDLYEFKVYVKDSFGNVGVLPVSITVDSKSPEISVSNYEPYAKEFTLEAEITDKNLEDSSITYSYTVDGKAIKADGYGSNYKKVRFDKEGKYTNFIFSAKDKAGNEGNSKPLNFIIDQTAPVVTTFSSSANKWTKDPITITASVINDDGSPIDYSTWQYKIENGNWAKCNKSADKIDVTIKDFENGEKTIYFSVKDEAGNEGINKIEVKYDTQKPTAPQIINSSNEAWTNKIVLLEANSTDNSSEELTYYYSYDRTTWMNGKKLSIENECNKTVYFKSVDKAGNESDISSTKVKIDKTKPSVPILTNSSNELWTNKNVLIVPSATDEASGVKKYEYSFDQITWNSVTGESVEFSNECNIDIYFHAIDNAGNISSSKSTKLKIDKTQPEIKDIKYSSNGKNLTTPGELILKSYDENTASYKAVVLVEVTSTDNYAQEKKISYDWKVYQASTKEKAKYKSENVNKFNVTGFLQDRNYIEVIAIDEAGNRSKPVEIYFANDDVIPNAPVLNVSTATHRKATKVEDATRFNDFSIDVFASKNSMYGFGGFVYWLETGKLNGFDFEVKSSGEKHTVVTENAAHIEYKDLKDNDKENEMFYRLCVASLAKNGVTSKPQTYTFRIDTTPPENYVIYLVPQIDSENWYGSTAASLHWIEKADDNDKSEKTGVQKYEYRIIPEGTNDDLLSTINFITIDNPTNGYIDINIEKTSEVQMRFTDFAGNVAGDTPNDRIYATVQIDTTSPDIDFIDTLNKEKLNAVFTDNSSINIRYGKCSDEESGLDRIDLVFTPLYDKENSTLEYDVYTYTDNSFKNEIRISDLFTKEISYSISLYCYDKVGNYSEVTTVLFGNNSDEIKNMTLKMPYSKAFKNFQFEGEVDYSVLNKTYQNFTGQMILPISIKYPDGKITNTFDVAVSNFDESTIIRALSKESNEALEVEIDGNKFSCSAMGYSKDDGLIFKNVKYLQKTLNGSESFEFVNEDDSSYAGFIPLLKLTASFSELKEPKVISISEDSTLFKVNNVNRIEFNNSTKKIYGKYLTITLPEEFGFSIKNLPVVNVTSNAKLATFRSDIICDSENNVITQKMNGIDFKINSAYAENNKIKIINSTAHISINEIPYILILNNYEIDFEKKLIDGKNLSVTITDEHGNPLKEISDGTSTIDLSGNNIKLTSDGCLVVENVKHLSGKIINNLKISNSGFDYSDVSTSHDSFILYGFGIKPKRIYFESDKVVVVDGEITINNNNYDFEELRLNSELNKALENCPVSGSFEVDLTGNYKKEASYTNLLITPEGVTANVEIALPEGNNDATWELQNVLLKVSTEGQSCYYSNDDGEKTVVLGGYKVITKSVTFDGNEIKIISGTVDLSNTDFLKSTVAYGYSTIENISFNHDGIINNGSVHSEEMSFVFDDWNFYFLNEGVKLTKEGIAGQGAIVNENENENNILVAYFDNFIVKGDGTVNSNYTFCPSDTEKSFFLKNDYLFYLEGASFGLQGNKYVLNVNKLTSTINTDTVIELPFENVKISSNSNFLDEYICTLSSNTDTTDKTQPVKSNEFISANGYNVDIKSATLNNNGIALNGDLKTEALSSKTKFTDNEIKLFPNFIVTADESDNEIIYNYAGWEIKGKGVTYDYHTITVKENTVEFGGANIELGELKFNDNYQLISSSVKEQDYITVNMVTPNSKIFKTTFDQDGLKVAAEIALPIPFDGVSIIFDTIYVKGDGNFYIRTALNAKTFSVMDLDFTFHDIMLGSNGIFVSSFNVTVHSQQSVSIDIDGLEISSNGHVYVRGVAVSPFEFLGMTYCVQNFSIKEDGIYFQGYTTLPQALPGVLSGMTIGVNNFYVSFDGSVYNLDIKAKGHYAIPIQDWTITFADIGVEASNNSFEIVLGQCGLIFPADFKVNEVSVSDLRYDLVKQEFRFDEIKASTEFEMELSGITLMLNELSVTSDWTFGFKGNATFDERFPEFLHNADPIVAEISFSPNEGLKDVAIKATGLNGKIINNVDILELNDGKIEICKTSGSSVSISIKGGLYFTESAPQGMQNVKLEIEEFTYDGDSHSVTALSAGASGFELNLNGVKLEELSAAVHYNDESIGYVGFGGKVKLPEEMPDGIKGTLVDIDLFRVSFDGTVNFDATTIIPGPLPAFDALIISDFKVRVSYYSGENSIINNPNANIVIREPHALDGIKDTSFLKPGIVFGVKADIVLSKEKFPEGIGGTKTSIDFVFSGDGIEKAYADCRLVEGAKLFDNLTIGPNTFIALNKKTLTDPMDFFLTGSIMLPGPEKLPQGIANSIIYTECIRFNSKGELITFDAGVKLSSVNIFNAVSLDGTDLHVRNGNGDFIIDITGNVKLVAQALPANLKNAVIDINKFELSTSTGVKEFNVGLRNDITFPIMTGLDVTINSLSISNNGFACSATADLNIPGPKLQSSIALTNLEMDWNFRIIDIQGGLKSANVDIAGFKGIISGLYFVRDPSDISGFYIKLDECRIILPENAGNMANKEFAIKNANFRNGKFEGDFEIPEIDIDIVGFNLKLIGPEIDFSKKEIRFSSVVLDMPEALKEASIGLSEVKISSKSGLSFGGGEFKLPDFAISDGVGFTGLYVKFVLNDGKYEIEGSGGLVLANCGEMQAQVSFTNISSQYPIGLKRAFFSFEASAGGIPLGSTGLQFSGIRGGIAYGEPNEVPVTMRYLFDDDGIRLQLGLTLTDIQTTGKMVQMKPDTWVDVKNLAFAFSGQMCVLKGTFDLSAQADAGLSRYGFYTGLAFTLKVVKGNIEFYVWNENGVMFSGRGSCHFGLQKGALLSFSFKLFWKRIEVNIPPSDIWLAKVGAEFGSFKNQGKGFKAYADFSGFGNFGIFVGGKSNIKFGNVSSIQLVTPKAAVSNETLYPEIKKSISMNFNAIPGDVSQLNLKTLSLEKPDEMYHFTVNNISSPGVTVNSSSSGDKKLYGLNKNISFNMATRSLALTEIPEETSKESGLDRIIFVCSFVEGDPDFYAVSPSGKIYKSGDKKVETTFFENCITFIVHNPEAGDWSFGVSNIDEDMYAVDMIVVEAEPEVTVSKPSMKRENATNTVKIAGSVSRGNSVLHVYASEGKDNVPFELGTLEADAHGKFESELSTDALFDGEYNIFVRAESSSGEESKATYAVGTYLVDRSKLDFLPPENLLVAERESYSDSYTENTYSSLIAVWSNTNGNRTKGYRVKVKTDTDERELNVGNAKEVRLSNFIKGEKVLVSVCAYDENGFESRYSEPVSVIIGENNSLSNSPVVIDNSFEVDSFNGKTVTGVIEVNLDNFENTNSVQDYIRGKITSINNTDDKGSEYFTVILENFVKISGEKTLLPWKVFVAENCPIGTYEIGIDVINEGNIQLRAPVTMKLNIKNPVPVIENIEPSKIDGTTDSEIIIYGDGFVNGSKYYLDNEELIVKDNNASSINQKTLNIPASETRGKKELRIVSPDNQNAVYDVEVIIPGWEAFAIIDDITVEAGNTVDIPLNIEAYDDYSNTAEFISFELPDGIEIEVPELVLNEVVNVKLSVSERVSAGLYNIALNGNSNNSVRLDVKVTNNDEFTVPKIKQIAPYSAFVGDKVTIYGTGFGSSGKLMYNHKSIAFDEWTSTSVTFTVTKGMETGLLYIQKGNINSNGTKLYVRERGFSIKPAIKEIVLHEGTSETVQLAVNGYAKKAKLGVNLDPSSPFTAELTKSVVTPNGITYLSITPDKDAVNGEWNLVIEGSSEQFYTASSVKVVIKDRMDIDTSKIYEGKVGIPYSAELNAVNAEGDVEYILSKGLLPAGLRLTSSGVITGTPTAPADKFVTITAQDAKGQKCNIELNICVSDNSWAMIGKDEGNTRSTTADMPSNNKTQWTVDSGISDATILASENMLFIYNNTEIKTYNDIGKFRWKKNLEICKIQICSDALMILTKENILYSIDKKYGNVFWTRQNVSDFTVSNNTLITQEGDSNVLISVDKGELISTIKEQVFGFNNVVWNGNSIYQFEGNILSCIYGGNGSYKATNTIKSVSADASGFVVVTTNSIVLLDPKLRVVSEKDYLIEEDACVITGIDEKSIFVSNGSLLEEIEKETYETIWTAGSVKDFAVANEKVILVSDRELKVLNRYSGKTIWDEKLSVSSLALYAEKLYVITKSGDLICYNGTPNATAPVTEIKFAPEIANGDNGWYNTTPVVTVNSEDAETFVKSVLVSYDGNNWTEYRGASEVADGYTTILAYGIDSRDAIGEVTSSSVKVDTVKPVSSYTITGDVNVNEWIDRNVELTLTAEDELSGVEHIYINEDMYHGSVLFNKEGVYDVSWYAKDYAGNIEDAHKLTLKLDKFNPISHINVKYDNGISVVYLSAEDSGSGIDRIEYSLNGSARNVYCKPIVLLNEGENNIEWEAFDISGKTTGIIKKTIYVSKNTLSGDVLALPELNNKEQKAAAKLDYSSMILNYNFKDWSEVPQDFWQTAYANTLPQFVLNGDFIQWNGTDMHTAGHRVISWFVKKAAVLYMFASPTMTVSRDWNLIEEHSYIQTNTCPDGHKLYMRRAFAGEEIIVEMENENDPLPLIVVKNEPKVTSQIELSRTDCWDDIYYAGKKPYRQGVQVVLTSKVSPVALEMDLPVTKVWTYEIDGKENKLESLWFDIPEVNAPKKCIFRYKVISADGKIETISEKTITIEQPDAPETLYPWFK